MPFLDRHVLDRALGLADEAFDTRNATKPVVSKLFHGLYGYDAPPKLGFTGIDAARDIPHGTLFDVSALDASDPLARDILWRAFLIEELYDVMRAATLAEAEAS